MRIIHLIGIPAGSIASVDEYVGSTATPSTWRGARCEVLISSRDVFTKEEYALEIEGDLDHVRSVLEDALEMLQVAEASARERVAKCATRERQCVRCQRWYDGRFADEPHGDGQGGSCTDPSAA